MKSYDYKDIQLISRQISTIASRDEIDCSTTMGFSLLAKIPIISAPMVDVVNGTAGKKIGNVGALAINHRFQSIEDQVKDYQENKMPCAVGINESIDRIYTLYSKGCRHFCIDVANGASTIVRDVIEGYNSIEALRNAEYIVGNVCSGGGFDFLQKIPNVIGIRVGVAGGHACGTRNCTGIYHPMVSLIIQCNEVRNKRNGVALIADGGIREPQDMCKALAFGADFVMVGSILAAASDSPALTVEGKKIYRGSASAEIQKLYKEKPKYIEGKTRQLDCSMETIEEVLVRYQEGLVSSMSYMNARNLKQYRKNFSFCVIQ